MGQLLSKSLPGCSFPGPWANGEQAFLFLCFLFQSTLMFVLCIMSRAFSCSYWKNILHPLFHLGLEPEFKNQVLKHKLEQIILENVTSGFLHPSRLS